MKTKDERVSEDRTLRTDAKPQKRLIAVGKKTRGRWAVRTSLWRYLASTAISQ